MKLIRPKILAALLALPFLPISILAQTPTPLMQFQFNESYGTPSLPNTGSISCSATVTGTIGRNPGMSEMFGDRCFNNTAATGMGSLGTAGGAAVSASALGSSMQSLTLQGWFKSGTVIGNGARLMDCYSGSGFTLRGPVSGEPSGAILLTIDGQTVNSGSNTYSDTNLWIFFAATYDSVTKKVKFYKGTDDTSVVQVGGDKLFTLDVGVANSTTTNFCIGNLSGNNRPYDGYMDCVRVYGVTNNSNGALTIDQLEALRQGDLSNATAIAAVTVNANSVIRSDISRTTFGSGVEHQVPAFRTLMQGTGTNAAARTEIADMNLGMMRFPQGTTGLFYYWNNPPASYISATGILSSQLLTPNEIYSYTDPTYTDSLNMDRLFEVNTFTYVENYWTVKNVNVYESGTTQAAVINTTNLDGAATYAANWVKNNKTKPATSRVTYWEVGNEDWSWWSPEQYAQIFNAFAPKMIAENGDIKLLAQTITAPFVYVGGGTNGADWTGRLATALGSGTSNVYALSEHEYLNGNANTGARDFSDRPGTYDDRRVWQTQNMFAKVQNATRLVNLKESIASRGLNWKIWMTEFNVIQNDATTNEEHPYGIMKTLQDLGHGVVIADFTGRMLELGVERILIHSIDTHPSFSIVDYVNGGGSIPAPIKTVPGLAYEVFPQEFGSEMVSNTITNNPLLSSNNEGNFNQVSVYSSIRDSDNCLVMVVINRSYNHGIRLTVNCSGRTVDTASSYVMKELYSPNISDSNREVPANGETSEHVSWSAPTDYPISGSVVDGIVCKEHSVNLIVIPLVP